MPQQQTLVPAQAHRDSSIAGLSSHYEWYHEGCWYRHAKDFHWHVQSVHSAHERLSNHQRECRSRRSNGHGNCAQQDCSSRVESRRHIQTHNGRYVIRLQAEEKKLPNYNANYLLNRRPVHRRFRKKTGDDDMPGHVKSSLMGVSLNIPITNGRLALGTWQGVYLNEHRDKGGWGGGHARNILITLQGQGK